MSVIMLKSLGELHNCTRCALVCPVSPHFLSSLCCTYSRDTRDRITINNYWQTSGTVLENPAYLTLISPVLFFEET
jgi:hypothetical protein